jgi:hypothetical protein
MTKTMHRERVRFERPVLEEIRNVGFLPSICMSIPTIPMHLPV